MSRALDDLTPEFKPVAMELLARCAEAGIPVMVINTLRSEADQAVNIANGVSWTTHSKHLAQPPSGKADAIDVCPYAQYDLHGPDKLQWDGKDAVWAKIGTIGERLGLTWGGRWQQQDLGHFEFNRPPATKAATPQKTVV
jgi:D-alanyl-D-alanine carboxypeptidase